MRANEAEWRAPGVAASDPAPAAGEAAPSADLVAEVRALRARLRAVEAALGTPGPPGQRPPPSVPELARRLTALERRAGVVPGLAPLPGLGAAGAPLGASTNPAPPARRVAWRECGQAALAAALLVTLVVWLLRPGGAGDRAVRPPTAGPPSPAARATLTPRAVPAAPGTRPADLLCLLNGSVPCVVEGAPVPPGVWGRDESCPTAELRVCLDWGSVPATPTASP